VNAIQQLHAAGVITKGWQTTAWSGGQKDPWAVIYQDGTQLFNGGADEDIISSTDIGSWLDGPGGLSVSDVQTLLDAISKLGATEVYGDPTHLNSLKDIRDHVLANSAELNDLKAVLADVDLRVAAVQAAVATIAAGPASVKVGNQTSASMLSPVSTAVTEPQSQPVAPAAPVTEPALPEQLSVQDILDRANAVGGVVSPS
jgi:hypothetical protein